MAKESKLVRDIIKEVKRLCPRAYVRKLSDRFTRGLADILILAPRWETHLFVLAVEAKTKTGKTSALQENEGRELNALPCTRWLVARSVEDVIGALREEQCIVEPRPVLDWKNSWCPDGYLG